MESRFDILRSQARLPFLDKYVSLSDPHPDGWSLDKVHAFQDEALRELLKHAYANSPFYREKLDSVGVRPEQVKGVADLAKLPFTTKEELRGNPWALLACDKKDLAMVYVSTGTTGGEQIYIWYTWRDFYINDCSIGYPRLVPVEPGDIVVNALPYEMSSAGLAFHKAFMDGCGATVVPVGKGGAYSTPEKTIKILRDLQPTVLITTPSWAVTLSEAAERIGFDLATLPLRQMWITGEGCSFAFRNRLEKIWGTTIDFYYGSLEAGFLGVECKAHNGYHVPLASTVLEVVNPETGEVLEPGEIGEIVATSLFRYDTPILRYRTQDLGYIECDKCSCGVELPRLFLRGRQVDQVTLQGVSFSPYYLEEFLMRLPEVGNWYQFVVPEEGSDRLKIRVELQPGLAPSPELAERLASRMEFAIGVPCDFELFDKLPRPSSKTIRVVHE